MLVARQMALFKLSKSGTCPWTLDESYQNPFQGSRFTCHQKSAIAAAQSSRKRTSVDCYDSYSRTGRFLLREQAGPSQLVRQLRRSAREVGPTLSFFLSDCNHPPLPFQQLTSAKSPISPLNPDFLPFIAFFVRNGHRFNRITMTHSTHRNFWVSQVGFPWKSLFRAGSRLRNRGDSSNPELRKARAECTSRLSMSRRP